MAIQEKLIELGLTLGEIDTLGIDNSLSYYRFHHNKKYQESTVVFSGIEEDKLAELKELATNSGIKVNSRLSSNLTFLCLNSDNISAIEKARKIGCEILSPEEFKRIFCINEYTLNNCAEIYDSSIEKTFRIGKPLSNFNSTEKIESFSLDSDNVYELNLYEQKCSCPDFEKSKRSSFPKGDLRRMCKHLLHKYSNDFGLTGLDNFQRAIVTGNHPIYPKIHSFSLPDLEKPIIVNYKNSYDWWNIYVLTKNEYVKYGFLPSEERFAYDDKPIGLVKPIREKLKAFRNQLRNEGNPLKKQDNQGCAGVVLLLASTLTFLVLIFLLIP